MQNNIIVFLNVVLPELNSKKACESSLAESHIFTSRDTNTPCGAPVVREAVFSLLPKLPSEIVSKNSNKKKRLRTLHQSSQPLQKFHSRNYPLKSCVRTY